MNKEFTENETLSLMYKNVAQNLNEIANHIERCPELYDLPSVVKLLREIADEQEAQSMVVELRDNLK